MIMIKQTDRKSFDQARNGLRVHDVVDDECSAVVNVALDTLVHTRECAFAVTNTPPATQIGRLFYLSSAGGAAL